MYQLRKNNVEKFSKNKPGISISKLIKKIILIIISMSIILLIVGITYIDGSNNTQDYETVVVESGQNLWGIAREYYGENNNIRKIIFEIRDINNLDNASLDPGQKLKLPME